MSRVQWALLPAVLIGIFLFLGATHLIGKAPAIQTSGSLVLTQPNSQPAPQPSAADPAASAAVLAQTGTEGESKPDEIPVVEPVFVNVTADPNGASSANGWNSAPSLQGCTLRPSFDGSVLQWCELIQAYANANGLEPALVAALITQESGGDPNAYSGSGAVGLMQIMPRDGLAASFMCAAGPCFTDRPSSQQLYDPEYNIAYGTRLLSSLLQRYGNIRDALMSYGPHDVGYYYADIVLGIYNANR